MLIETMEANTVIFHMGKIKMKNKEFIKIEKKQETEEISFT